MNLYISLEVLLVVVEDLSRLSLLFDKIDDIFEKYEGMLHQFQVSLSKSISDVLFNLDHQVGNFAFFSFKVDAFMVIEVKD